jgi:hypothetical protein
MRISILHCRHATSTGEKTFKEIQKTAAEYSLQVKQLRCVTIHGARNVCGTMTGLVGKMCRVKLLVLRSRWLYIVVFISKHSAESLGICHVLRIQ